jgi:N-acetylneuraminic acid mutarotase
MNKKFGLIYSFVLLISLVMSSCGNSDDDLVGNWVVASTDFAGKARGDASSFVIGNKLYVFGGYNGTTGTRFKDLWVLDVAAATGSSSTETLGSWKQLADLDASTATVINASTANYERNNAVGFAIGTKGYIGTGYNGTSTYLKDFWEYNPGTDKWTQIADIPGGGRYGCYSFAVNDKGYIGGGYDDNYLLDVYRFDPATGTWSSTKASDGSSLSIGKKRAYASTFVIGDIAYLVGGVNSSSYNTDFWAFDGATETWTEKRKIANVTDESFDDDYKIIRSSGSTFVLNGKGYYTCGTNGALLKTTWEYDPATDLWDEKTGFEKTVRTGAIGATVNGRGLILTGKSGSSYLDDINEFYPNDEYNSYD